MDWSRPDWIEQYEQDKLTYQSMCPNCGKSFMYLGLRVQDTEQAVRIREDGVCEHVKCPDDLK